MEILTAAEMAATDRPHRRAVWRPAHRPDGERRAPRWRASACADISAVRRVTVLCGKGNNGGDGLVVARVLAAAGRRVEVVLLARASEVKGEGHAAALQLPCAASEADPLPDRVRPPTLRTYAARCAESRSAAIEADLIVDAVLGTGFRPPLHGVAVAARDLIAKSAAPVVAVDLPSGWDADSMDERV